MRKTNREKPFLTNAIDSVFDAARKAVHSATGYIQTNNRLSRKAYTAGLANRNPLKRRSTLTQRINKAIGKIQQITLDKKTYLYLDENKGVCFDSSDTSTWKLKNVHLDEEFKHFSDLWVRYKVDSLDLILTPVAQNTTFGEYVEDGVTIYQPLLIPKVSFMLTTDAFAGLAAFQQFNKKLYVFDPGLKRTQVQHYNFKNKILFDQTKLNWRSTASDYWASGEEPVISVAIDKIDTMHSLYTQGMPIAQVNIKIHLSGLYFDEFANEPGTTIGVENKQEKLDANPETVENMQMVPVRNPNNHKLRRIGKRINMRWDKIFSDPNCLTDDDAEPEKKAESVKKTE